MTKKPIKRKANSKGFNRDEMATAKLNASSKVAKLGIEESKKSGGLRQSIKTTETLRKSDELFGEAVSIAKRSFTIKKAGARMGRVLNKKKN